MKKLLFILLLVAPVFTSHAQSNNIDSVKKRIVGVWQDKKDNANVLTITGDSIFIMAQQKADLHGSYTISNESCTEDNNIHTSTGLYIVEKFADKTLCCALAEVNYFTLKILYPDGKKMEYGIKSDLPH